MSQQQENFARMQESNFFFLSSLTTRRDGEAVQAERSRVLSDALKDTTMVRSIFYFWKARNYYF